MHRGSYELQSLSGIVCLSCLVQDGQLAVRRGDVVATTKFLILDLCLAGSPGILTTANIFVHIPMDTIRGRDRTRTYMSIYTNVFRYTHAYRPTFIHRYICA